MTDSWEKQRASAAEGFCLAERLWTGVICAPESTQPHVPEVNLRSILTTYDIVELFALGLTLTWSSAGNSSLTKVDVEERTPPEGVGGNWLSAIAAC